MNNSEYTFENSFCILLNEKGRKLIDPQLKKLKCKRCGTPLCRVTYMEGDVVFCEKATLERWHSTGYEIDVNSIPPRVVKLKGFVSKIKDVLKVVKS